MERGRRIELLTSTWKDEVIPFYEPRVILCNRRPGNTLWPFVVLLLYSVPAM